MRLLLRPRPARLRSSSARVPGSRTYARRCARGDAAMWTAMWDRDVGGDVDRHITPVAAMCGDVDRHITPHYTENIRLMRLVL